MAKKSKQSTVEAEIHDIQEEARDDFDLSKRLAGRAERKKTITVYSDADAGDELGYADEEEEMFGIKTGRRARSGLLGELDALQAEGEALAKLFETNAELEIDNDDEDLARAQAIPGEIKALKARIEKLRKQLKETSFEFTLHTLPEIIQDAVKRETRDALKIKGKGIPDARQEEYNREFVAQMLVKSTERWVDLETGEEHSSLSLERARSFKRYLPRGQFDRLDEAMVKLSFQAAIANSATDNADF
jgi:seryl-tRNA synthetase